MTGYIVLTDNMKLRLGEYLELNKEYSLPEGLKFIEYYPFFYSIEESLYHYMRFGYTRLFEADIPDESIIKPDDSKVVFSKAYHDRTYKIKLTREVSEREIRDYIEDNLDHLLKNRYPTVRAICAHLGYGLEVLIDDNHWIVRIAVASQGYGLDKLINDENEYVRIMANHKLNNTPSTTI